MKQKRVKVRTLDITPFIMKTDLMQKRLGVAPVVEKSHSVTGTFTVQKGVTIVLCTCPDARTFHVCF